MLHCWCVGPGFLQKRDGGFGVCWCWVVAMWNSKLTAPCFALRSKIFFRWVLCLGESYSASCHLLLWTVIVQLLPQVQLAHPSVCLQGKMVLQELCAADEYVRRGMAGKQSYPPVCAWMGRMTINQHRLSQYREELKFPRVWSKGSRDGAGCLLSTKRCLFHRADRKCCRLCIYCRNCAEYCRIGS